MIEALAGDTDLATEARRLALFRSMSPARKLELVEDANRLARELAPAGIAVREPRASETHRFRILMGLILGAETAEAVYGPASGPA